MPVQFQAGGSNITVKKVEEKEFNILIGDFVDETAKALFDEDDEFISLPDDTLMPHILAQAGVFESANLARKNGWGNKREPKFKWSERHKCDVVSEPGLFVPEGFTDFVAGKGKTTRITIFKATKPYKETIIKDEAFIQGFEKKDNNYNVGSDEWKQWWLGWSEATDAESCNK